MKLLVMGATGRTGMLLVGQALRQGHQVVAIARDPAKLAGLGAEIVPGTPYDYETVARALAGCDAVANVLNVSRTSDSPWAALRAPADMISRACANALAAMAKAGVKRYVTLSTVGAGESWQRVPFILKLIVSHSNLRFAFDDHTAEEQLLQKSGVDYTVARAPLLKDKGTHSGVLAVKPGEKMRGTLTRQAAAEFLVSILESGQYPREIVHISNR